MPTYQYACTACGHRFEAVQSFTDDALSECPECAGRLRKLFSSVGVVFKGSGFYRTDSRSANGSANGAAKSGSDSGADTKSTTKTESATKSDGGAASTSASPSTASSTASSATKAA